MRVVKTDFEGPGFVLRTLLSLVSQGNGPIEFGTVTFPRGYRHPRDCMSVHDRDEISLVLRGRLVIECGREKTEITVGDAVHIPAGEAHVAEALEESHIYFALVGALAATENE